MAVSKNMREAVAKGDVDDIRICLHSQLFMDIIFASGSFDENIRYLEEKLGEVVST